MIRATISTVKPLPPLELAGDQPVHVPERPSLSASTVICFPAKTGSSLCKLLGRLRYKHLLLLVALDEHRNLHRAAKAVHLAQPTATGQVRDLELLFGAPLFDRLPSGMRPTELGTVVLVFAHRALGDLKRLSADLDHRRASRSGRLVIGAISDVLPDVVPRTMAEMKRRLPTLAVELLGDSSDRIIDRLIEGETDMVLGYFSSIPRHEKITCEALGKEALSLIARNHHPLCHIARLSVDQLERVAWILHAHTTSQLLNAIYLRAGLQPPANTLESNSLAMTVNLLLGSDAITLLPESAVRNHLQSGQLARLPLAVSDHHIEFAILTRREDHLSPAAVAFTELLRSIDHC